MEKVSTIESNRTSFLPGWFFFGREHSEYMTEFVRIVEGMSRKDLSQLSLFFFFFSSLENTWNIPNPFFSKPNHAHKHIKGRKKILDRIYIFWWFAHSSWSTFLLQALFLLSLVFKAFIVNLSHQRKMFLSIEKTYFLKLLIKSFYSYYFVRFNIIIYF